MKLLLYMALSLAISTLPLMAGPRGGEQSRLKKVVKRSYETRINAKVKINNGIVYIDKAVEPEIFNGEFIFTRRPPTVNYEVVGNEGQLTIRVAGKVSKVKDVHHDEDYEIDMDEVYENECYINLSPDVPLDLKMDLGVTKGEMDLGGFRLNNLDLTTAVSSNIIEFSEPNPQPLEEFRVENGVGKLQILNIGNSNFRYFSFEGGVGKYVLDFDGEYQHDATGKIELGMGKLTLFLPRNIGVRLEVDKTFLSSFDIDKVYKEDDTYYNELWNSSKPQLDLHIESGIGKIEVQWIE
ncbi:MAG: hypothetical protein D6748_14315 [Calditrichaeota bacterium]|nr:MAG: hypothetical protein D6748_14315 [Calditrichota bacterium]